MINRTKLEDGNGLLLEGGDRLLLESAGILAAVYEPAFDVDGWFDPTRVVQGWFDDMFTSLPAGGDGTATPTAVALVVTIPAATATGGANTSPATIARTVSVPAPTSVTGGANTSPAAIARTVVVAAPTTSGGSATSPAAVTFTVSVPAQTTTGGGTTAPATVTRTVVVPAPTVTGGVSPPTVALTATVPAPNTTGGSATSPAAVTRTVSVPAPNTTGGSATSPAAVTRTVSVPAPTVTGGATYYISPTGSDAANGLTTGTAWLTLGQHNTAAVAAGSVVCLERGGIWRESLVPRNGVTYTAYGSGAKPSIRGSNVFSGAWTNESGSVWYKGSVTVDPGVFAHNGILGQRKTAKVSLAAQWDYWWDDPNDRLYTFSSSDPNGLATTLEYGVRNRILNDYNGVTATFNNLDVRHNQGDITFGLFSANLCTFTSCDFSQIANNAIQFHNGSGGSVSLCTFTDWGVVNGQAYAIQSIGFGTTDAQPVDIEDNTFTITHNSNSTEIGAVMNDLRGYVRRFNRNICDGTVGTWPNCPVTWWRPASNMTSFECLDNTVLRPGSTGIAVQELDFYGATGTATVARNIIRDSCNLDAADTEALRLRNWASGWTVTAHHNLIERTTNGVNDHHGIRVNAALGVLLYNNTVYGCDDGIRLDNDVAVRTPTATAKNNLSAGNRLTAGHVVAGSFTAEDHNLWFGTVTGFTPAGSDVLTDPLLANPTLNDFRLLVGSPAFDAGVVIAGITDGYFGANPDMGALEGLAATPATVALTVSVPAATVTGGAATTPATITRTVVVPAPSTTGGGTTTPAAVALTVVTPAPTVTGGGGDGTATPATVALAVSVPAQATSGGSNTSPTAIARTVVVPAPTSITGGANTSPAAIARTVVAPAATTTGGANTSPAAIARTVVVPAPTTTGGTNISPAAVALTTVTPAATATGGANTSPAAIARTVVVPAPTATGSGGGQATPATVALAVTISAPTGGGGAVTTPAVVLLAASTSTSAPATTGGATTTPPPVSAMLALPAPTNSGGANTTAATITLLAALAAATTTGGAGTLPPSIALLVAVGVAVASGSSAPVPDPYPIHLTAREMFDVAENESGMTGQEAGGIGAREFAHSTAREP